MERPRTFRADAAQFGVGPAADGERARVRQTCCLVQRRHPGPGGVGEQGPLTAPAAALFAPSQAQVLPQAEPGSDIDKMSGADQMSFELRKIALVECGEALE